MTMLDFVTPRLPYMAPMLCVYFVGVILSLMMLSRSAVPAAFALVGCGILFLSAAAFPFVQGYLLASPEQRGWDGQQLRMYLDMVVAIDTLLRFIAFALILAAIFSGRKAKA